MKVLYISGYTDSFIAGHGVLETGTSLLHKPFTEEELTGKACEVLDSDRNQNLENKPEATLVLKT
jgi:hypothetical protein